MVWSVDMCGFVSVVPKEKRLYNIRWQYPVFTVIDWMRW